MIKKIIFKKITFNNFKNNQINKIILSKGLFVFPSGFGLASIEKNNFYHTALKKADHVFFDSGFFVILLRIFKNIKVEKFSGFKFLVLLFNFLSKNKTKSIFCIDPNLEFSKSNRQYLKNLGLRKVYNYVAPTYNLKNLLDKNLLEKINKIKPDFILTNIGGGVQEVLGLYLKDNLKFKSSIICTGGAISFLTGDQAPINNIIDKFYLGWLVRLIFNPSIFFKRFLYALRLLPIVFSNSVKIIK